MTSRDLLHVARAAQEASRHLRKRRAWQVICLRCGAAMNSFEYVETDTHIEVCCHACWEKEKDTE